MIKVLIVEDDPMVAEFNKRFLKEMDGFTLAGVLHSVNAAIDFLARNQVHLILLDVYMPGATGIELIKYVREHDIPTDVIVITAAADKDKIQTALRYGAVDYLIKPFEFERFQQALLQYKKKHYFLSNSEVLRQEDLDERILSTEQNSALFDPTPKLPKGLTSSTLQSIIEVIRSKEQDPFSTDEISETTLISRVSVRKYLKFLAQIGVLEESLTYGIGRPLFLYRLKKDQLGQLSRMQ
ncbi:response regulator [Bacillus sp. EB01]|uniref:response regulator n=1 Tax=Bacillus sp. EB01 TaxID=1347086 RepID=UPI0005C775E1|nr:response regulator [Bacillus sp. EB01]